MRKRKQIMSSEQWEQVHAEGEMAKDILSGERFNPIMQYLSNAKKSIEEKVIKNEIRDVEDHRLISAQFKKVFFWSKKEQLEEMSGRYKMIEELEQYLTGLIQTMDEVDKLYKNNLLEIK